MPSASAAESDLLEPDLPESALTACARVGDPPGGWARMRCHAASPVSGASLAVVRMVVGSIGAISAVRLLVTGWVETLYAGPANRLAYPAMSWVPVLPVPAMRALVVVMGLAAVAVAVGCRHRAAAALFLVSFSWVEFTEASVYLNHYWFVTLFGVLLVALPFGATWSLDARRRGPRTVPLGAVRLVRVQVGVVYVFAGVAKLHGDWLVHGLPLALWLPGRSTLPLVGPLLESGSTAVVLSWAGALFDCTIVGFLLWRRTRLAAWFVVVGFHLATWRLFPVIGVFPWVMIGVSTIFFEPDWPERVGLAVRRRSADPERARRRVAPPLEAGPSRPVSRTVVVLACLWIVVQVALPLRHLLYEGDHRWTGEAYRFGWNVLLVEKAGDLSFRVTDRATGRTWRRHPGALYTPQQLRVLSTEPELIRQAAHAVADESRRAGPDGTPVAGRVEVRADAFVSLNGRRAARLVDPDVDLAAEPWRLGHQRWILDAPTSAPPGSP